MESALFRQNCILCMLILLPHFRNISTFSWVNVVLHHEKGWDCCDAIAKKWKKKIMECRESAAESSIMPRPPKHCVLSLFRRKFFYDLFQAHPQP